MKFMTTAITLLQNSGEMYVAQFLTFKNGEMIMKFPNTRALPRKGEHLMCMVLPPELQSYKNWGKQTYRDLYKQRCNSTECACIWHSPSDDKMFSLVGFSKVSLDFANYIEETPGLILTFAPQRPPIDYVMNLQKIVEDKYSPGVASVLDANYEQHSWQPVLLRQRNVTDFIYAQLNLSDTLILQGPPGTGKTYMIAELCAKLCSEGNSVLVTALTNHALMEIVDKPAVKDLLEEKRIYKTNVTTDECKEAPKLSPIAHIAPISSSLVLSTYFISSGFAADLTVEQPFDYVIMDEASQALFSMFAASKKMGKKNLWVGDTNQLAPIVLLNGDLIRKWGFNQMVNGLELLAGNSTAPIYQLTTTYRFGQRAAEYTGMFYNNSLVADKSPTFTDIPSLSNILSKDGGPTMVLTDMPPGECPEFAILLTTYLASCVRKDSKTKEMAILTCFRTTTRALATSVNVNMGTSPNIIIDTVARVQGLTTDVTFFFVPNTSYIRTLEPHLFNVATSRAKEHTIIIADKNVLEYPTIKPMVRNYLEKLIADKSIYVPAKQDEREKLEQSFLLN